MIITTIPIPANTPASPFLCGILIIFPDKNNAISNPVKIAK